VSDATETQVGRHSLQLRGALDELEVRLKGELDRHSAEHDMKHREHPLKLQAAVDSLEAQLREDLRQLSKDHDAKLERVLLGAQAHVSSVDELRSELAGLTKELETQHQHDQLTARADLENLAERLQDELAKSSREQNSKVERCLSSMSELVDTLNVKLREELHRVSIEVDQKEKLMKERAE